MGVVQQIKKEIAKREKSKNLVKHQTIEYCKKHKYQQVCNTDKERKEFARQHHSHRESFIDKVWRWR